MSGSDPTRPAQPGELCTCGRQAAIVIPTDEFGDVGACGIGDGGTRKGPCPFCGDPRSVREAHDGRCPQYTLNPGAG